jgi:hypothetical protein
MAKVDAATMAVYQAKGTYLVAISRLGKGETQRRLHRERFRHIENLLYKGRGDVGVRLITGEGETVPELGRVELYACNELIEVLVYKRNQATAIPYSPW